MVGWYACFIAHDSEIKASLTKLLKKTEEWKWGKEQQTAFERLKSALTSAPVLARPDFSKPFKVQCDASEVAVGAVLMREQQDGEHPIVYARRSLTGVERNYSTAEKECLAMENNNAAENVQQEAPIIALVSVENKVASVENLPLPGLNSSESSLVATMDDVWDDIVATIEENSDSPAVVATAENEEILEKVGATVELVEPEVTALLPNEQATLGDWQQDEPEDESAFEQPREQAQDQLHEPMQEQPQGPQESTPASLQAPMLNQQLMQQQQVSLQEPMRDEQLEQQPQGPVQVPLQGQQLELQLCQEQMEANGGVLFKKRKRGCRGGRKKKPSLNRQLTVDEELSFDVPPRDDEKAGPPNRRQSVGENVPVYVPPGAVSGRSEWPESICVCMSELRLGRTGDTCCECERDSASRAAPRGAPAFAQWLSVDHVERMERDRPMQIDAQDESGNTPLHLALTEGNEEAVESLLRKSADLSLANATGKTPLHIVCSRENFDDDFVELFFDIGEEKHRPLRVDARGMWSSRASTKDSASDCGCSTSRLGTSGQSLTGAGGCSSKLRGKHASLGTIRSYEFSLNLTCLETTTRSVFGSKSLKFSESFSYPTRMSFFDFGSHFLRRTSGISAKTSHPKNINGNGHNLGRGDRTHRSLSISRFMMEVTKKT
ncbi:unnamed protein product, partial [Trichogramma brassicae]